jgi:hypothetical protein
VAVTQLPNYTQLIHYSFPSGTRRSGRQRQTISQNYFKTSSRRRGNVAAARTGVRNTARNRKTRREPSVSTWSRGRRARAKCVQQEKSERSLPGGEGRPEATPAAAAGGAREAAGGAREASPAQEGASPASTVTGAVVGRMRLQLQEQEAQTQRFQLQEEMVQTDGLQEDEDTARATNLQQQEDKAPTVRRSTKRKRPRF